MFWPGVKRVFSALKWQKRDGKMLNIHRQSGFLLSVILIIEAITGAWISFPGFFAMLVEPGVEQPERRRRGGGPQGELLQADDGAWMVAINSAAQSYDGRLTGVSAPTAESGTWSVTLSSEGVNATASVPLDGGEVSVEEGPAFNGPPPAPTRAIAVSGWMRQVHYAMIGGIIWELLVFISGIVMTFLALSGIYIWGKRELFGKKKRKA